VGLEQVFKPAAVQAPMKVATRRVFAALLHVNTELNAIVEALDRQSHAFGT
jgi:hypothetical protein